ncbi:uncharacterized protein [Ptychodera flava]|uniref:uncharacterized protein n=1 Tax=Ptychodera flava TaxID=63121 RepID=UPI00396A453C
MCKLRFNSKGYTRMYMMNRQSNTPGTVVYNSEERWELEHQNVVNTSSLAWQYVQKHPQFKKTYTKHLAKQRQLEKGVKKGNTATGSRQQSKKTGVSATSPSTGNIHSSFSGNDKRKKPKKDNQGTRSGKEKYRDYDEAMNDGNTRYGSWSPHDDENHRQGKTPTRTYPGDWQVQTPWRYPYSSGTTWPQGLNLDSDYHGGTDDRQTYLGDTVGVPGRRGDSNTNYLGNFRDFPMDGEQRGINGPYRYLTNPYGKYSTQEPFEAAYRQLESMDYPSDIWKHLLGQPYQEERYRMFEPAENLATGDKQGKFRGKNSRSDGEKRNAVFQSKKSSKRLGRNSAVISDNDKSEDSDSKRDNARVVRKRSSVLGDDIQFLNSNQRFVKVFVTEDDLYGNSGALSSNVDVKSKYTGSHKPKWKTKAKSKRSVFQGNAMNTDHAHHNYRTDNTGRKRSISETLKRNRRHVGPHDGGGMQRLLSTGTLAPVLNSSSADAEHSIDVIFATYWFYPAKTRVILPAQQKCIDEMMDNEVQRFDPNNQYYGDDHDAYEDKVMDMCLGSDDDGDGDDAIHESQTNYNPFNIHMGQMTVYRMRLKCTCEGDPRLDDPHKHCSRILPYSQQQWAAYMGTHGNSLFKSRDD